MKKKAVIIIIVVVIIILIGVAIYLFVKGGKNGNKDTNKDTDTGGGDDTTPGFPPAPAPSPAPGSANSFASAACTKDAFPLGRGAKNQCVIALQTALGITADGNFGPMTESAVRAKGYVVPLTNADFDKIIAGISAPVPVTGTAIKFGDRLKATGYTPIFEDAALTKPLKTKNASGGTTGAWYFRKDDNVGMVQTRVGKASGSGLLMRKITNAPGCPNDCRYDYYVDKYYQYTKF